MFEEEQLVLVDELPNALERDIVISEGNDAGIREGLSEVEELPHHAGDLEGQNGDTFQLR